MTSREAIKQIRGMTDIECMSDNYIKELLTIVEKDINILDLLKQQVKSSYGMITNKEPTTAKTDDYNFKKEVINACHNYRLIEFINHNYSNLSKEELRDIAITAIDIACKTKDALYEKKEIEVKIGMHLKNWRWSDEVF